MTDWYWVARMSVKSVVAHTRYPVCEDDFSDMLQVAAIAIWQAKPGMSEAYYFSAGRTAVQNWLTWWEYGAPRDKLRGMMDELLPPVSLDGIEHLMTKPVYPRTVPTEYVDAIREIFYQTRYKKYGVKTNSAVERDTTICVMLMTESETIGIAHELGLSVHMVNRYRADIRKRLKKYANRYSNPTCQNIGISVQS